MSSSQRPSFTEPTTSYWQEILPALSDQPSSNTPRQYSWPAVLPDGRQFLLPIRPLHTNPKEAVASLFINHASFCVVGELSVILFRLLDEFMGKDRPDMVIGLPTAGLCIAVEVAKGFGHSRSVPLGFSQKFWYDEALSTELSSVTSPLGSKRVYLDPNLLPLVKGKKVILIDDTVSSGKTMKAVWDLLESEAIGCNVAACGVFMKQSQRWRQVLGEERSKRLVGVFDSPLLKAVEGGWVIRE